MCCVMPPASPSATLVSSNGVEQRRLAVVDVSHDRDDRCARYQIFRMRRFGLDVGQLLFEAADQDFGAEVARDHRRGVGVERRVDRQHHPAVHDLLQDVFDLELELVGEVLDGHPLGQGDELGDRRRGLRRDRHHRPIVAAHGRPRPWTCRAEWPRRARGVAPGSRRASRRRRPDGLGRQGPRAAKRGSGCRRARTKGGRTRGSWSGSRLTGAGGCGWGRIAGRVGSGRAAGASPVTGSSIRSRRVGGTRRPVGLAGAGCGATADAAATAGTSTGLGSAVSGSGSSTGSTTAGSSAVADSAARCSASTVADSAPRSAQAQQLVRVGVVLLPRPTPRPRLPWA